MPLSRTAETIIEYTHRITSGIALLLTLGLTYFSRRYPPDHRVRKAAFASGVFILLEALIGAGLVLFDLVGGNTSAARAVASALHLSNTYFLLGAITLTAIWAHSGRNRYVPAETRQWALIFIALLGILVVGASGAITALGDTLFPAQDVAAGLAEKLSSSSHFLVRLRVIHPVLALLVGALLLFGIRLDWFGRDDDRGGKLEALLVGLIFGQWIAGAVNVLLLAPIWMQILHLFIADLILINFLIYLDRLFYIASSATAN